MRIYKIAEIPKECLEGDCYDVAGRYITDQSFLTGRKDLYLVHGTVTGQDKIKGVKYEHAWIEDGDEVIDMSCGRDIRMPKVIYYALGQIENVKRYNFEEFRKMFNKFKHYGPWS